jgi:lambda repressor-like predicted transcriptional regulator
MFQFCQYASSATIALSQQKEGRLFMRLRLKVKEVAEEKGFSMGRLERLANLSHPTVRDIFRNPYKEVTTTTLAKLATALGVPVCALYEEVPDQDYCLVLCGMTMQG